jgi:hypothetical protein
MAAPDDFSFGWQEEFLAELMRRPKYVRTHYLFSRILNFLFLSVFREK